MRPRYTGWLALALLCIFPLAAHAQKPTIQDVLKAMGDYLIANSEKLKTVAAEEEYTQREPTAGTANRRLTSDVVFVGSGTGVIAGFRDAFGLDGHQLRQRDDRLLKIFQNQSPDSEAARALGEESVRHYISPNLHPFDIPTLALEYLLAENQQHAEFSLDNIKKADSVDVALAKFKVRPGKSVLPVPAGAATTGRVWVEAATGTVRQTEITVSDRGFMLKVTTKYALDPTVGLWVPQEMIQQFDMSTSGTGAFSSMGAGGGMGSKQQLEGRARYSKYRRASS